MATVFDHSSLPFLRGGCLGVRAYGYQPIGSFGVLPRAIKSSWGSQWKKAAVSYYDRTSGVGFTGEHLAYTKAITWIWILGTKTSLAIRCFASLWIGGTMKEE